MPPLDTNDEEDQQKLNQDGATPFSPADPPRDDSQPADSSAQPAQAPDPTHPATDTDVDSHELYDAGVEAASGQPSPASDGNAAGGYDPGAATSDATAPAPSQDGSEDQDNQAPSAQ